jgi:1,4-dihydroxy-2-naphthoate octaprenyltransferase
VAGARPRTLPAAIVPVAVGIAVAWWAWRLRVPVPALHCLAASGCAAGHRVAGRLPDGLHAPVWWRAGAAGVVALAVQVGTNYANDYSDGIRGTDVDRVGPVRLLASGLATPAAVRRAALMSFAVAAVAGLALAAVAGWWLLAVGAASFVAGWAYTGGPRPYGYLGLGELFVFVFFGLVATVGTVYVMVGTFPAAGWVAGVVTGLSACAMLEANNLRDVAGDTVAGKHTLAVRLGRRRAGWLYIGSLGLAAAGIVVLAATWDPWAALALLALFPAAAPARLVLGGVEGKALLPVLGATARVQLVSGVLLCGGLVIGGAWR